jgi:hypothetical protein
VPATALVNIEAKPALGRVQGTLSSRTSVDLGGRSAKSKSPRKNFPRNSVLPIPVVNLMKACVRVCLGTQI